MDTAEFNKHTAFFGYMTKEEAQDIIQNCANYEMKKAVGYCVDLTKNEPSYFECMCSECQFYIQYLKQNKKKEAI